MTLFARRHGILVGEGIRVKVAVGHLVSVAAGVDVSGGVTL